MSDVTLTRSQRLTDRVPYAYSATTAHPAPLIFFAGACPLDAQGAVVGVGDLEAQARQCVANLLVALDDAGAGLSDVLFLRVLVATVDAGDLGWVWTIVHDAFADHEVPGTLHGVTVLGWPGQLVEVEAVAARPTP